MMKCLVMGQNKTPPTLTSTNLHHHHLHQTETVGHVTKQQMPQDQSPMMLLVAARLKGIKEGCIIWRLKLLVRQHADVHLSEQTAEPVLSVRDNKND